MEGGGSVQYSVDTSATSRVVYLLVQRFQSRPESIHIMFMTGMNTFDSVNVARDETPRFSSFVQNVRNGL